MKSTKLFCIIFLGLLFIMFNSNFSFAAELESIEKSYQIDADDELLVIINVDAGQLDINKNDQSDQIFVSAKYDPEFDEVNINYDKKRNEFELDVDRDKWFKSAKNKKSARIELLLPSNVIICLKTKIKAGETRIELGGLSLREFELRNLAGEVKVSFSEPNQIVMEYLDVNVKVGETVLRELGNARLREADINSGIGELNIDFTGKGVKMADVNIDLDIGETNIMLPRSLGVRLKSSTLGFLTQTNIKSKFDRKGRFHYSENYDSAKKTLHLDISSGIGELRFSFQ